MLTLGRASPQQKKQQDSRGGLMFHFSVDSEYVDFFKISDLESVGIQLDPDFQYQARADAQHNSQKHGQSGKDSAYILNSMPSNFCFRVKRYFPGDIPDALLYLQKYFSHPPLCVWLNNTPHIIAGQYGKNIYREKVR